MLNLIFGILAVGLTLVAYYQTDRVKFLKVNVLAVTFFGLTLYVNNGISGAFISFVNVAIYVTAIYTSKRVRQRLVYIVPPIAFLIAYGSYETNLLNIDAPQIFLESIPYIPAIGTFFVSLSALQQSIVKNKIILFIGVMIWGFYSYLVGAWFAVIADVIGLATIIVSLKKIHNQNSKTDIN